jgi:hypothetical protein
MLSEEHGANRLQILRGRSFDEEVLMPILPGGDHRFVSSPQYGSAANRFVQATTSEEANKFQSRGGWNCFQVYFFSHLSSTDRFAGAFAFFCCATFVVPICMMASIGEDPDVKFWITDKLWMVLFLPGFYIIAYILHAQSKGPIRLVVALSIVASSLGLVITAELVSMTSRQVAHSLALGDCRITSRQVPHSLAAGGVSEQQLVDDSGSSWLQRNVDAVAANQELSEEWLAALSFNSNCIENSLQRGLSQNTSEGAIKAFRIQECDGYLEQLSVRGRTHWNYLGSVEERYHCAGWCSRGPPLWTLLPAKDSCAASVAELMHSKVDRTMHQVVVYSILSLIFATYAFFILGMDTTSQTPLPFLHKEKYDFTK